MNDFESSDDQLLIVVGADIRAEISDRPLAYRLRDRIMQWQAQLASHEPAGPVTAIELACVVVCSDLCYLNSKHMQARPAIAVGAPGVNAASASLAARLPTAFIAEERFRIHLDSEFIDRQACIWGIDAPATADAIDLFAERYLDDFLQAAGE